MTGIIDEQKVSEIVEPTTLPSDLAAQYKSKAQPETAVPIKGKFAVDTENDFNLLDTMLASYRQNNFIGSYFAREEGLPDKKTTDFDPWMYMTADEILDDNFTNIAQHADNIDELEAARKQQANERADRQTLSEAGGLGMAVQIGQGIFDPVLLMTGSVVLPAKTYQAGNSILRSGMVTGSYVAGETAVEELLLHETQMERTFGESAVNVSASAFLSGVLGSGIQAITNKTDFFPYMKNLGYKKFDKEFDENELLYHGTDKDFSAFDISAERANNTMNVRGVYLYGEARKGSAKNFGSNIYTVVAKKGLKTFNRQGDNNLTPKMLEQHKIELENAGYGRGDPEELNEYALSFEKWSNIDGDAKARVLKAGGYEKYVDGDEIVILDPKNIKIIRRDSKYIKNDVADELEDTMNVEAKIKDGINPTVNEKTPDVSESTAGAQAVFGDVEVSGKLAKKITEATAFTGPLTRTLTSESQIARQTVVRLADNPIKVEGYKGQSVEQLAKTYSGNLAISKQNNSRLFNAYKNNGGKLKQREFNEAVAKAVRSGKSDIPEVKQSADYWMENLYNPLKQRMIEEKLLPEDIDVSTSVNYLNRIYDKGKIADNYNEFTKRVSTWLRDEDFKMHAKSKSKEPFEEQDYEDLAEQIANRILGTSDGVLPYDWQLGMSTKNTYLQPLAKLRGPMQKRVFNISDEAIEDFLINDIDILGERYFRQTSVDTELMREFGDISMQTQINDISKDYTRKMEIATKKADEAEANGDLKSAKKHRKESVRLNKKRIRDIADIEGMRDRMRGVYNIGEDTVFSRIGRTTRDLNYLRFMGGVTISSLPDVARVVMAEGFIKTFGNGLIPLIRNAKNFKIAADELKGMGIGTDGIITGRSQYIADIADYTQGGTMFERGARSLAGGFGKINILDYWTAGMKQLQGITMQTRIFDDLKKGKYDKRLERLGISKSDADAMWKQVQQHGKKVDGIWLTNRANWDNPELAKMYAAAMRKESDRVIIIPGQEKPLFMSREMGGLFFQFRSFIMSATQRVLIAGLQNQDHNTVGGLLSLIGMGMLVYTIKTLERGEELSDDPRVWVMEGIDRSGAIGILAELNVTLEKISQNKIGLRPLLGVDAPSSKYVAHSLSQTALGPTFGSLLNDTIRATSAGLGPDEMTEADIRTLRRILPYQNLTGVKQALDKVEEAIGDSL